MKNGIKRLTMLLMAVALLCMAMPMTAMADGVAPEEGAAFLALGADLKESERATVLGLLGITEADLAEYSVIEITNAQEKEYLGDYLSASVIGSRALSSVLVLKQEDGYGITVETHNINYCTEGMYRNALLTAGVENARVLVAGPFQITGTAALVGALQAYSGMTGEEITSEEIDTAVNELVLTGALAEELGNSQGMEDLVALVKQNVLEKGLTSDRDIREAVLEGAKSLNLSLSDKQVEQVTGLMDKISKLDIDTDALKEQAGELYNRLKEFGSEVDTEGFMAGIGNFFSNIFSAIAGFFSGIFGK